MRKSRSSASSSKLKRALPIRELCRKGGFSDATFYKWRAKYGGMDVPDAKRLRELEAENGLRVDMPNRESAKIATAHSCSSRCFSLRRTISCCSCPEAEPAASNGRGLFLFRSRVACEQPLSSLAQRLDDVRRRCLGERPQRGNGRQVLRARSNFSVFPFVDRLVRCAEQETAVRR